jgi:hypothetical protein
MTNATKIPRKLLESDVERQVIASDLSPSELFSQKAEESLNLSYQITDAKGHARQQSDAQPPAVFKLTARVRPPKPGRLACCRACWHRL